MKASPKDEVEGSSVPKTAQQHRHQEIEVLAELAVAITTKRNIEVVLQPRRKADVPTAPKLCDGFGFIGTVEVLGELESEQKSNTDGHI